MSTTLLCVASLRNVQFLSIANTKKVLEKKLVTAKDTKDTLMVMKTKKIDGRTSEPSVKIPVGHM